MGNRFQIQAVSLRAGKCWRNWERDCWFSGRRELPASFWCCMWGFSKGILIQPVLGFGCCCFLRKRILQQCSRHFKHGKKCRSGKRWKWWRNQQHFVLLQILAFSHIYSRKCLWLSNQLCLDFLCISREGQMQAPYVSALSCLWIIIAMWFYDHN